MIFRYDDIPTYLQAVLADRGTRDSRYSLRALARDLGLSPAFLSQLLARKRKLSSPRGLEVAARLGLEGDERRYSREYTNRMASLCARASRRTQCYQLNVQLFNLTDGRTKRPGAGALPEA